MTEPTVAIVSNLRNPAAFEWYIIPLAVMVIYFYSVDIGKGNWSVVMAGLAFWGMDWFTEICNAMFFHFSQVAPLWSAPGNTSFLILAGLNVEICLMFAVMGLAAAHLLPSDRKLKILGIPNRIFFAVTNSAACVIVELFLNRADALVWYYSWWNHKAPWLNFALGYFPYFVFAYWVYDMKTIKEKCIAVGAIYGVNAAALGVFGVGLKWI